MRIQFRVSNFVIGPFFQFLLLGVTHTVVDRCFVNFDRCWVNNIGLVFIILNPQVSPSRSIIPWRLEFRSCVSNLIRTQINNCVRHFILRLVNHAGPLNVRRLVSIVLRFLGIKRDHPKYIRILLQNIEDYIKLHLSRLTIR